MKKKNKLFILIGIALAAFGVYWFFIKPKDPLSDQNANIPGWDQSLYNEVLQFFKDNADPNALTWMRKYIRERYDSGIDEHGYHSINGYFGKGGALLATIFSTYSGNPTTYKKNGEEAFNQGLWDIFNKYKNATAIL